MVSTSGISGIFFGRLQRGEDIHERRDGEYGVTQPGGAIPGGRLETVLGSRVTIDSEQAHMILQGGSGLTPAQDAQGFWAPGREPGGDSVTHEQVEPFHGCG